MYGILEDRSRSKRSLQNAEKVKKGFFSSKYWTSLHGILHFRVCWTTPGHYPDLDIPVFGRLSTNENSIPPFPQSEALNMNDLMTNFPPESIFSPPPSNALIPHLGDPDTLEGLARWFPPIRRCYSKRRTCRKSEVCLKHRRQMGKSG